MKKKITILKYALFLFGCVSSLTAQEKETLTIPLSNPDKEGKLVVHVTDGSITVNGYDGNEVVVVAQGRIKSSKRHKSKAKFRSKHKNGEKSRVGMKRITDNGLSYTVEEINNTVYIKYAPGNLMIDFEVKVPRNFSVDLKSVNNGVISVDNVNGTHEVSNTNGPISMTNVGGSVIADALNKDLTVSFKKIHENTAMMFSSLNGDIDITFPKNLKANIMARSDHGNVYTDFEIALDKTKPITKKTDKPGVYQVKREKGISGAINGGGANITFKTLNGDILIRSN